MTIEKLIRAVEKMLGCKVDDTDTLIKMQNNLKSVAGSLEHVPQELTDSLEAINILLEDDE